MVKAIVEYAEEHDMDLIVIWTRGMSGIKKMLLGSTASGVITYSLPCLDSTIAVCGWALNVVLFIFMKIRIQPTRIDSG